MKTHKIQELAVNAHSSNSLGVIVVLSIAGVLEGVDTTHLSAHRPYTKKAL